MGSSTAESLALGNCGAAGLAWAATSAFGAISVTRACITAVTTGWLRVMLGLRSAETDRAIGMDLDLGLTSGVGRKARSALGSPIAIMRQGVDVDDASSSSLGPLIKWRDAYALDRLTLSVLSNLNPSPPHSSPTVYTYNRNPCFRRQNIKFDCTAIILSFVKVIELRFLWINGASFLAIITALPWLYFLLAAMVVEYHEIRLRQTPTSEDGNTDIITGIYPSVKYPGGDRKIFLGAQPNSRRSTVWRFFWAGAVLLVTPCLFITYFLLSLQSKYVTFIWTGFQFLWQFARIIVHHFSDPEDPLSHRAVEGKALEKLSPIVKMRVLSLTIGVAKYQVHIHPRLHMSYQDDLFSPRDIATFLTGYKLISGPRQYPAKAIDASAPSVEIDVKAVIGDTVLSSASWILGHKLQPMDVYDCCIVVFTLPSALSSRTVAISAARVLAGTTVFVTDTEKNDSIGFVPKGASNPGYGVTWYFWVPCESGLWLQFQSKDLKSRGKHTAKILTDQQLSNLLGAGMLNISLAHVDDVKEIVKMSHRAAESLTTFLS